MRTPACALPLPHSRAGRPLWALGAPLGGAQFPEGEPRNRAGAQARSPGAAAALWSGLGAQECARRAKRWAPAAFLSARGMPSPGCSAALRPRLCPGTPKSAGRALERVPRPSKGAQRMFGTGESGCGDATASAASQVGPRYADTTTPRRRAVSPFASTPPHPLEATRRRPASTRTGVRRRAAGLARRPSPPAR